MPACAKQKKGRASPPPCCSHFTSPRALFAVLIRVPREPAAPPWVRTRVLPPLIWFAQRRARAPCATGRRVIVNWMPSMVVVVIGCGAVCSGILQDEGAGVNLPRRGQAAICCRSPLRRASLIRRPRERPSRSGEEITSAR